MTAYLQADHVDKHFDQAGVRAEGAEGHQPDDLQGQFISIIGTIPAAASPPAPNLIADTAPVSSGAVLENRGSNTPAPSAAVTSSRTYSLLPWLTVYENVNLAVSGIPANETRPGVTTG